MSEPAAAEVFSAHAQQYTALRRRLVPVYDAFYGAVIDVLSVGAPPRRVLDLGAGTGLLSEAVATAFPAAQIDLLDASEPMLREAGGRLGDAVVEIHVSDMADPLPAGPYDAVVSALAIHHLEDSDKRALMRDVLARLRPHGVFVNAEQVAAPDAWLTGVYESRWADECRALGATDAELQDARERMRHDRCTDVDSQLAWLREAGFASADCVYKHWRFAVMAAFRDPP